MLLPRILVGGELDKTGNFMKPIVWIYQIKASYEHEHRAWPCSIDRWLKVHVNTLKLIIPILFWVTGI